jgi:hypothetical protein
VKQPNPEAQVSMMMLRLQRKDMITWLIEERHFTPKGAVKCIDNFLESMQYVLDETGDLPDVKMLH